MMAYESPITLIQTTEAVKEIKTRTDEVIFKAVVNVLPQVDKDELIKALAYDREQYDKGYHDRDSEIVRCKDCKHWASAEDYDCEIHSGAFGAEDFCSYGERKGGDDE